MKGKPAEKAASQLISATSDEISRAIDAMREDEFVRLRLFGQNRIFRIRPRAANRRTADDLLQEAVMRLLDGTRHWYPCKVTLVTFLVGAMRSIASEWASHRNRNKAKPEYASFESERTRKDDEGNAVSPFDAVRAEGLNVEEQAIEEGIEAERKAIADEIEQAFSDDEPASMVI